MSVSIKQVCNAMERWAPSGLAYEWDRVGLQIGEPDAPVTKVLTCLTVTEDVVARAEKWGANLIVAHHPILFRPLKSLRSDDTHTRLCLRLATANIAVFAAHTNLDVVPDGVNTLLAETLGLQEIKPLVPIATGGQVKVITFVPASHLDAVRSAMGAAGAGVIGNYDTCSFSTPGTGTFHPGADASPYSGKKGALNHEAEVRLEMLVLEVQLGGVLSALRAAHPYEEPAYDVVVLKNRDLRYGLGARGVLKRPMKLQQFAEQVRSALNLSHVRLVGRGTTSVKRIAVCGGAGGGEIGQVPKDIDVFVTGDLKYHEADSARERGLALIDAGHVGTERGIAPHIARYLRKEIKGITVKSVVEGEIFKVVSGDGRSA